MYRNSTNKTQIIVALIGAFALVISVLIPYLMDFIKSEKFKGEVTEDSTNLVINTADETNNINDNNRPGGEGERKVSTSFLDSQVYAVLNGSNINIKVNKDTMIPANIELKFPFRWGFILSSSFEDPKIGEKEINLEVRIDKDYSVISTVVYVVNIEESGEYEDPFNNELKAEFDGQYFILSCDINNEYISLEDICVRASYYKGMFD